MKRILAISLGIIRSATWQEACSGARGLEPNLQLPAAEPLPHPQPPRPSHNLWEISATCRCRKFDVSRPLDSADHAGVDNRADISFVYAECMRTDRRWRIKLAVQSLLSSVSPAEPWRVLLYCVRSSRCFPA